MIKINLLPIERRRKEKTPLPRFLIIIAGVTVVLLLLIWNIYLLLENKNTQETITEYKKNLESLQLQLAPLVPLQMEQAKLLRWEEVAKTVEQSRSFRWWKNVDILLDIFEKFPKVWISSPRFQGEAGGRKIPGQTTPIEAIISFDCHYAIENTDVPTNIMTDLRKELKTNPELHRDFQGINPPSSWRLQPLTLPDAKEEWEVLFNIELYRLKKTEEKPK